MGDPHMPYYMRRASMTPYSPRLFPLRSRHTEGIMYLANQGLDVVCALGLEGCLLPVVRSAR